MRANTWVVIETVYARKTSLNSGVLHVSTWLHVTLYVSDGGGEEAEREREFIIMGIAYMYVCANTFVFLIIFSIHASISGTKA